MDFSELVVSQIKAPLDALCEGLMAAGELDQYLFFEFKKHVLFNNESTPLTELVELTLFKYFFA